MGNLEKTATRVQITSAAVAKALKNRAKGKRVVIRDLVERSMYLTVGPRGGVYSSSMRPRGTRTDGKRHPQREYRLGTCEELTPAQARIAVEELRHEIARGIDPRQEAARQAAVEATEAAKRKTLAEVGALYISAKITPARGKPTEHQRQQKLHVEHGIEETGAVGWIGDVSQAHIQSVLDNHRNSPATARHRAGALDRMMRWAVKRGYVALNPFADAEVPPPPAARQRRTTAGDIQALWNAEGLNPTMHAFTKLALLVPLRATELAELTKDEVDIKRLAIVLPGKRTKNGDPFTIPLSDLAMSIVQDRMIGSNGRLFQLNTAGGAMNSWANYNRRVRKFAPNFGLHDMRKVFVSVLAEQGRGDADTTDSLLNHRQSETRAGVRAAYHQANLWPRQVRVMRDWAELIAHAVEHGEWPPIDYADNVVELIR